MVRPACILQYLIPLVLISSLNLALALKEGECEGKIIMSNFSDFF